MNKILNPFVILSTLIVVTTVSATKYVENEGILILGYNELNQAIKEFDHILIAFFSPWCGLFRSPPFEYKEAAAFLRRDRSATVKFAKIDVNKHQKSWEQYNLRECPTLKFFMKGEEISYDGGRSSYEISNWIRRQLRSTTIELESFQHLSKLQWWKEVIVIFLGGKDHKYWPAFWKASRKLDQDNYDVTFAYTSKADIISELKVPEGTRLVLLKKFDELRNELAGSFDAVSLLKFIEENRHPLVPTFDQNAAQRTFKECIPTIFLLHGDNKADLKAKKTFYEAAQQLKGKIHFAYSNPYDGGLGPRLAEYLEVGKREIPLVILVVPLRSLAKKLYRFERELTTENLIKFYDDYKAGTLTRWLKSEAIPKINDKPVKVVVGKTFSDIVLDPTKDVFIVFYFPWDNRWKEFALIWDELVSEHSEAKNVVFAKMDASANKIETDDNLPVFAIRFYPAINKSNPLVYEGEKTKEAIISWIRKQRSGEL